MNVTLTPQEAIVPATVGLRRHLYGLGKELRHHGTDPKAVTGAFLHHVFGAMAEFAVARVLNLFWEPNVGTITGNDVGGVVEVRLRLIPGSGTDLAIRPKDKDDRPYVLVHNRHDLRFELVGWLYAGEGKHRGPFDDVHQCWYVPPPYRPVEHLLAMFGYAPNEAAQ